MINAVIGELVFVNPTKAVISTGYVEFELLISGNTASALSQRMGSERKNVRLLAYLQHKEDGMTLYGFMDEEERTLFLELIKVNGIGPRQAQKILSGIRTQDFIRALDTEDVKLLASVPGLGQKTAQKIILALRDTLTALPEKSQPRSVASAKTSKWSELIDSLVDMGYDKRKVVDTIAKLTDERSEIIAPMDDRKAEEYLFREAIMALVR